MTEPAKDKAPGSAPIRPAETAAPVPPRPVSVHPVPSPSQASTENATQSRDAAGAAAEAPGKTSHPHPAPGPKAVPDPAAKPGGKDPAAPPAQDQKIRPPVGRARRRWRHMLVMISFVVCVVVPSGGVGAYLWGVAVDQYASRVGFAVRREDMSSATELLGGLTSMSGSSSSDTDILYEFIQSQKLVADIDDKIDLKKIWSRPDYDPVFALDENASIEALVDYWDDMVRISYGAGSGLLEVEARAFSPEDATLITETLLDKSSEMINQLSAIAREDSLRYARNDLEETSAQLKEAREALTRFRNENQIIDPQMDLKSQSGLMSTLQAQQAETLIELDLLRDTARENDPRIEQAQRRLEVIESRLAAERRKLGFEGRAGEGGKVFADLVGEYERLSVDREFAEKAYSAARAAYDTALAEARRQSRYLAAYMEPTRPETAEYPRRLILLAVITLFLFLIWSSGVLVAYSVKDRH